MKEIDIVYHSADLDGFCSGAIAAMFYEQKPDDKVNMVPYNYGDPIPELDGDLVVMLDVSFPSEEMIRLHQSVPFVWIDHHVSAIEDSHSKDYSGTLGHRKVGDSASLLAWEFFYRSIPLPSIVYYVDRYDVWKKEGLYSWNRVLQVQEGMRYYMDNPNKPEEFEKWKAAFMLPGQSTQSTNYFQEIGALILAAEQKKNNIICRSKAFDLKFANLNFAAVNVPLAGSRVLDSYATPEHDALMVFSYTGKHWTVSMYKNEKSDKQIDLSKIAKTLGGGGHANACGFQVEDINKLLD